MGLALATDFNDWYDRAFGRDGETFRRMAGDGPDRRSTMQMLRALGVPTPRFGYVGDLAASGGIASGKVVVYTDRSAHHASRGSGKVLMPLSEAAVVHPTKFACEYIPSFGGVAGDDRPHAKAICWIKIGAQRFWIRRWSLDAWRSTVGIRAQEILIGPPAGAIAPDVNEPLASADFVEDPSGRLLAVDLDFAPHVPSVLERPHGGCGGSISAEEVVDAISAYLGAC